MKRGLVSFCALWAVFAVLPVGAWASGAGASKAKHGTSAEFTVAGTDGYWLDVKSEGGFVTAVASTHWPPVATVSAAGVIRPANTGNVASDTYVTFPAPSDPNVIAADFGSAGSISVVFQPSGKVHVTTLDLRNKVKHCNAPHRIVRHLGTFTGAIKFQGEGGYTSVDLTSAKGSVGTSPFRSCTNKRKRHHGAGAQKSSNAREASLLAIPKKNASLPISFIATTGRGGTHFSANTVESLTKNLIVVHSAQASASANSFAFHRAPFSATIRPPAPFSGVGVYRGGHSPAWSGDLSVAFPGFEAPLTGPTLKTQFFPWG